MGFSTNWREADDWFGDWDLFGRQISMLAPCHGSHAPDLQIGKLPLAEALEETENICPVMQSIPFKIGRIKHSYFRK